MPTTARVVVLEGDYGVCAIQELELPDPSPHQAVVEIYGAGIEHGQLQQIEEPQATPIIPGREGTARVLEVGSAVTRYPGRTAADLRYLLEMHRREPRRLSKAALETLAIISYHQPITRAEIEEVRGVGLSKGTLDILMEIGWVRPRGRKRVPGRPITYGTTDEFLAHFDLEDLKALPGLAELKAAGLLDATPPPFPVTGSEGEEDPLEDEAEDETSFEAMAEAKAEVDGVEAS